MCKRRGRRGLARAGGKQFVADLSPLREAGVGSFLDGRDVDEHVLASTVRLDESVPLDWTKPLHSPHRHFSISYKKKMIERTRFVSRSSGSLVAKCGQCWVTATCHSPKALMDHYLSPMAVRPPPLRALRCAIPPKAIRRLAGPH